MSQHHRPEQLWARLQQCEREKQKFERESLEIIEALNRAESFTAPSPAPGLAPAGPVGFHTLPSQPLPLGHDGRSSSTTHARVNPSKTQQVRFRCPCSPICGPDHLPFLRARAVP